jgi:hypothetical protein
MDFITKLPMSPSGHNAIITVVDRLSKMAHFVPAREEDDAQTTADRFTEAIVRLHGVPSSIVSDRDPKFVGHFWKSLHAMLGTKLKMSTSAHPETDGQTERTNRTIEEILRHFVNSKASNWRECLPLAEFAYNTAIHSSTKRSPFEVVYGYRPKSPVDFLTIDASVPAAEYQVDQHATIIKEVRAALLKAQERMKNYADKHRREHEEFKPGDLVLLSTKNLKLPNDSKKFRDRYLGPFEVESAQGVNVKLKLPKALSRVHPVFHVKLIKKYVVSPEEDFPLPRPQVPCPRARPQVLTEEYEVEEIIQRKVFRENGRRVSKYEVKWLGYPSCENTWEPREHLLPEGAEAIDRLSRGLRARS